MPTLALYLAVTLLWGSTFLWVGIATPRTSPFFLADTRLLLGGAIAWALALALSRRSRAEHSFSALRPWFGRGLILSALQAAIPFVLLAFAQRDISSGMASILNSAAPLWAAAVALTGVAGTASERLARGRWPGLLIGICGVALLVGTASGGTLTGELLMMGVVVTYASGGLYAQRVFRDAPPHAAAILSTAVGGVVMIPLGIAGTILDPPDLAATGAVLALAVGPTGLAYVSYFTLIRRIGATRSLTVTYLVPVVAIALGAIFLDEQVDALDLGGLALILLGMAIVNGQLRLTRGARIPAAPEPVLDPGEPGPQPQREPDLERDQ